jgi:hypothetical protein
MLFILALFALQTGGPLLLTDEIVTVPPGQWRSVNVSLRQKPAVVECSFHAGDHPGIRIILMTKDAEERFQQGNAHSILAATAYQTEGTLKFAVAEPGDYAVVLDNRLDGYRTAQVRLKVNLTFTPEKQAVVGHPTKQRQALAIMLSFLFFAAIVILSGWKLRSAIVERNTPRQPPPFY